MGRVDYQDFDARGQTKQREMLWQASANLDPTSSSLFTGILPYGYNPPPGFCFDTYCTDDPIMDDKSMEDYNVDEKVNIFLNYTMDQRTYYKTNNLIMTMGSDFQYSNAHRWYKNLDKLIFYVNQRQETTGSKVNIFYSTPACYLYSLNKANTTWSTKNDDFFPYAHRPHSFWTGYFTSRISLKDFVRRTNNYLQSVRQLAAFAQLNDTETFDQLGTLERAMGVAQHHDAVSGTERQHVANDYAKRLSIGVDQCMNVVTKSLYGLLGKDPDVDLIFCPLLNITECKEIESQLVYVAMIYNPLTRPISSWIRLPTVTSDYSVYDIANEELVFSEFSPVYDETKKIPERKSEANYNLVFLANLPAQGFGFYSISNQTSQPPYKNKRGKVLSDSIILKNQYVQLTFDSNANLVQIDNLDTKLTTSITQHFCYYNSIPGNNSQPEFQASGAYIFRPLDNNPVCLNVTKFRLFEGKQFTELHQVYEF